MTLIASFQTNGYPALIGDLLISRKSTPGHSISLPIQGVLPKNFTPDGKYYLSGLQQKVNIINANLAVAWAGQYFEARTIINDMRQAIPPDLVSRENLIAFFEASFPNTGIELICTYFEKGKGLGTLGVNLSKLDTFDYGQCFVGGTARDYLIPYLYKPTGGKPLYGYTNDVSIAVCHSMQIAGVVLGEELLTGNNLSLYFGGGVEICAHFDNHFQKLGDILYLLWLLDLTEKEPCLSLKPLIIKVSYMLDTMLIQVLEMKLDDISVKREAIYVIPPMIANSKSFSELNDILSKTPPDWKAKFLCSSILVKNRGSRWVVGMISHSPDRLQPFVASPNGDVYVIGIKDDYITQLYTFSRSIIDGSAV